VKKQKGVTISGLLMVSALLIIVVLLGFKVVPVYVEYQTIQTHFRGMANDPELRGASRGELSRSWIARTTVDNIKSLPADAVEYTKEGDRWVISADYSVKVRLVGNVSACIDFHPTSAP
jgi:Domain of unknown function (DUF4845)